MPHLYVYYRVAPARRGEALAAVRRLADLLTARGGAAPRLMRRPDLTANGLETWMEIYPDAKDGALALIDRAVAESGLARLIEGERHVETFIDILF